MTILALLRVRWERQWRDRKPQILLRGLGWGLVGAYFGFFVIWAGLVFPETLSKSGVHGSPARVLNEHLLTAVVGLVPLRFSLQRFVGNGWEAHVALPTRRAIVYVMQLITSVSLLNGIPLVGIMALAWSTVSPATPLEKTVLWSIGTMVAITATHFAYVWLRVAWTRREWGILLGTGAAVAGLIGLDVSGSATVREASYWLFGGLQHGDVLPLVGLGAVTAVLGQHSTTALHRYTYHVTEGTSKTPPRRWSLLKTYGWGRLGSLVLLQRTLMLRYRRSRELLLATIILIPLCLGALFLIGNQPELVVSKTGSFLLASTAFFLSGLLPFGYGQFSVVWHRFHFDALLVRNRLSTLLKAHFVFLITLCVGPGLVALLAAVWALPAFVPALLAFVLYNAGVTCPALVGLSIWWPPPAMDPTRSQFTDSRFSGRQLAVALLLLLLLVGPGVLLIIGSSTVMLWGVAGAGTLGLATAPRWLPRFAQHLDVQRYDLADRFRSPRA